MHTFSLSHLVHRQLLTLFLFEQIFSRIEREKFYTGTGIEPEPLALSANALANRAIQGKYGSTIELTS